MNYVGNALMIFARSGHQIIEAIKEAAGPEVTDENVTLVTLLLLHRDGPQRPTRIAEVNGLTSGGATKLLSRLEDRGFVSRSTGTVPEDGRAVVVSLTPDGAAAVKMMLEAAVPLIDGMIDDLIALRSEE